MTCDHSQRSHMRMGDIETHRCIKCGARLAKRTDPDHVLIDAILGPRPVQQPDSNSNAAHAYDERRAILAKSFTIDWYSADAPELDK